MTSRKKYEIHAEEINNRRNSAPKWTQRNWFTRIYIHYSRASNLIVVEHPELASLFTINKRIYRSRFTKISSHGYTLLRWDESRQYSRVGGGTPETRVAFLYCSRMCRTSTVFITVCAPFSKRRILLREPPTPQDDDSLVHRPPPPGQGASRRRLRLYIYIYECSSHQLEQQNERKLLRKLPLESTLWPIFSWPSAFASFTMLPSIAESPLSLELDIATWRRCLGGRIAFEFGAFFGWPGYLFRS